MNPLEILISSVIGVLGNRGHSDLAEYLRLGLVLAASKRQSDAELQAISDEILELSEAGGGSGTVPTDRLEAVRARRAQLSAAIRATAPPTG
jgi:hypothetical protein